MPRHLKSDYNLISLEYAALFHDIGKLELPTEILNNEGNLNDEQEEIMRTHPQIGVRLLRPIESFDYIADWILYHHERWDGKGYPSGLKGDDIPLEARIMAIADVYDALVSKRVYKDEFSFDNAYQIIMDNMGKQFDPGLEKYFVRARSKIENYYLENKNK